MGAGGVSTQDVYAFMRRMEPLGPDGWLVPPPYYLRPSPEGIAWHYRQIADATDRPDLFMAVMNLARVGRMASARELFATLGPVIGLLFEAPNPAASGELGWRIANAVDALPSEQDVEQLLLKAA